MPVLSLTLVLLGLFLGQIASASDDSIDSAKNPSTQSHDSISPKEAFLRTQAVLSYFGVPPEIDSQPLVASYENHQTSVGIKKLLPFFDPRGEFQKLIELSGLRLDVFQDSQSREVLDFSANLLIAGSILPVALFEAHLDSARKGPSELPLLGLKIALDPGHMGGSPWDAITGKWVHDSNGNQLSEGLINLQTALLLEAQLQKLGASTLITHRELAPVTRQSYDQYDVHSAGLHALQEETLQDWFYSLLTTSPAGPQLYKTFSNNSEFKNLFSDSRRETYWNLADLEARVDALNQFQPDLTLIIHYDAATHDVSDGAPFAHDAVKVYVPGNFSSSELASREDRRDITSHLLDETPWHASVALAHQIAHYLSKNLSIPVDRYGSSNVKMIEPGVFSRNLHLLKKHSPSPVAYVECLFYNDPGEFAAFTHATHPLNIGGKNYPYSDRLMVVATSLREAVVQFVQSGFTVEEAKE